MATVTKSSINVVGGTSANATGAANATAAVGVTPSAGQYSIIPGIHVNPQGASADWVLDIGGTPVDSGTITAGSVLNHPYPGGIFVPPTIAVTLTATPTSSTPGVMVAIVHVEFGNT